MREREIVSSLFVIDTCHHGKDTLTSSTDTASTKQRGLCNLPILLLEDIAAISLFIGGHVEWLKYINGVSNQINH